MEAEREEYRKRRARSISVFSLDMPGVSEQSVALFVHAARDRSALMATLIDPGGTVAGSTHRFQLRVLQRLWDSEATLGQMKSCVR